MHKAEGDHIIRHHGDSADDRTLPDAHPLVNARQAAHDHIVANLAMPSNRHTVGQDHTVAKAGIVAHMCPRHQQAIVAHLGDTAAAFGADVQRDAFADLAACTHDQARAFAAVFQILRHFAHSGVGEDHGVSAHICPPRHHRVRLHLDPVGQGDIGANHAEGTNAHPCAQTRSWIDD